jgi:hypothetical protein
MHHDDPMVLARTGTKVPTLVLPGSLDPLGDQGARILADDWWMVLDRSRERILYRSTSPLQTFRAARRRSGGRVRIAVGPEYGLEVHGSRATLAVVRVPGNVGDRPRRVAIAVGPDRRSETVTLPDGGHFTWIPDGSGQSADPGGPDAIAPVRGRSRSSR